MTFIFVFNGKYQLNFEMKKWFVSYSEYTRAYEANTPCHVSKITEKTTLKNEISQQHFI